MPLLSFPNELLLEVAKHLNAKDTYTLIRANRRLVNMLSLDLINFAWLNHRHCVTALYLVAANHDEKALRLLLQSPAVAGISITDEQAVSIVREQSTGEYLSVDGVVDMLLKKGVNRIIQSADKDGGAALTGPQEKDAKYWPNTS